MFLFRIFRAVVFLPLVFLWQLLIQFLLSPWGLIVPMTLFIALFSLQQLQKTPDQLALYYTEQLETCSEAELPTLLEVLVRTGDPGVAGLVCGLTSSRESVFTASRNVLRQEFDRWQQSDHREQHFMVLSEALLQQCSRFSSAAQIEAMQFVEQMLQIRSDGEMSPESSAHRQQTIAQCEQILDQLASVRRRTNEPQHADFVPQSQSVAALDRRAKQPMLLASNGEPFVPAAHRDQAANAILLADADSYNALAVPRADRLWAYQNAQQASLTSRPGSSRSPSRLLEPQESLGLASFSPPSGLTADAEERIAHNFAADPLPPAQNEQPADISADYRNKKLSESSGTLNSDLFLTPELEHYPLERVPQLPPVQLMQLLHHPKLPYIESAQRTLIGRDGFQEVHLKLAWRLYHPIPAVRQEILEMLPQTPNTQPSVWLSVLLNDPNNDVRYRAASFLATSNDPALRRLLIETGRRDNDARIVNLANRLNDSRGNIR